MGLKKYLVGEVRPSQLLLTYGVGSIIDLPHMATLVMGLDDWNTTHAKEIIEERLLSTIQTMLGPQVTQLLSPPASDTAALTPFSPGAMVGVPVAPFPRWMVCPKCHLLAGYFQLTANPYYPDRTCYRHHNCGKQPPVLPSRFMIACAGGHLDDFPYHHFVHGDVTCNSSLRMIERGVSGEPSDIYIKCEICGKGRAMSEAFSSDEERTYQPVCRGRRPHLRDCEKTCEFQPARTILLAASNTWFPLIFSSLALPTAVDSLGQLIEAHWDTLREAQSVEEVAIYRRLAKLKEHFTGYSDQAIWEQIEQKQTDIPHRASPGDLKAPEWHILSNPWIAPKADDFEVTPVGSPEGYTDEIAQVVLVERLREVRALTGFTRLESLSDYTEEEELPADHIMPLSRRPPTWVPASEVRGEGIFIQFREEAIERWLQRLAVQQHDDTFRAAHTRWRTARRIANPEANYPQIRYVLLHTFAHALMRQLTLECGYTAASIRERIYAQSADKEGGAMAGILLYTAASDSAGTLGGLVSLGKNLGFHIFEALEDLQNCASDPLCAEHISLEDQTLHGAACHAFPKPPANAAIDTWNAPCLYLLLNAILWHFFKKQMNRKRRREHGYHTQ
jgi:hypothetical protein